MDIGGVSCEVAAMLVRSGAKILYVWAMRVSNSLIMGNNRSLYRGELPATRWHSHAAPVLLIGLSGRFVLRFSHGHTESCYSAWIDSGVEHVLDACGEQVATMYLEPDAPDARRWRAHFATHGGIVLDPCIRAQARSNMDTYLRNFDLDTLLRSGCADVAPLDPGSAQECERPAQARWCCTGAGRIGPGVACQSPASTTCFVPRWG